MGGRSAASSFQYLVILCFHCGVAGDRIKAWTLENCLGEGAASLSAICGDLVKDRTSAGRLAHYRDSARVTAESCDMLLDPFQSKALVKQAEVGNSALGDICWSGYEAKHP